jgi:hypothetical protein
VERRRVEDPERVAGVPDRLDRAAGAEHERRRMARAAHVGAHAGHAGPHAHERRRAVPLPAELLQHRVVEREQRVGRIALVARRGPQRVPGEPGDRRGRRALARHVADDEHPVPCRRERVVEVPADLRAGAGGAVARGQLQLGHGRQDRRQEARLQLAGHPRLARREQRSVEGEGRVLGQQPRGDLLVLPHPPGRVGAERHVPDDAPAGPHRDLQGAVALRLVGHRPAVRGRGAAAGGAPVLAHEVDGRPVRERRDRQLGGALRERRCPGGQVQLAGGRGEQRVAGVLAREPRLRAASLRHVPQDHRELVADREAGEDPPSYVAVDDAGQIHAHDRPARALDLAHPPLGLRQGGPEELDERVPEHLLRGAPGHLGDRVVDPGELQLRVIQRKPDGGAIEEQLGRRHDASPTPTRQDRPPAGSQGPPGRGQRGRRGAMIR